MRYFGVLTFGFGFLGSAFLIVQGVLHIASPNMAVAIDRVFVGAKKALLLRDGYAKKRTASAITGVLYIGFRVFFGCLLVRSLLYAR
jgi:hypothetical protein